MTQAASRKSLMLLHPLVVCLGIPEARQPVTGRGYLQGLLLPSFPRPSLQ
jgi:hypothetical protein